MSTRRRRQQVPGKFLTLCPIVIVLLPLFLIHAEAVELLNLTKIDAFLTSHRPNLSVLGDRIDDHLGLWNIERMAQCRLNCSAELNYNGYGCFCGIGGNGTALDGIDACCQMHDQCYDWAVLAGFCSKVQRYVSEYDWECRREQGTATGKPPEAWPTCEEAKNQQPCGRAICKCDQALVSCWSLFPKPSCKKQCQKGTCQESVVAVIRTVFGRA